MSVTAPTGFVASGVRTGIRRSAPDLALIRSLPPAVGAAVWTTNRVQAAPVIVSRRHLGVSEPQAVVVNSGVANAATGSQGVEDAERTAATTASLLGLRAEEVVVLSTGVIGVPLPMDRLLAGLPHAALGALGRRGSGRRNRDPHDRSWPEAGDRHGHRVHGWRNGQGRRDDPSSSCDDARDRHHGLPACGRRGPSTCCATPWRRASTRSRSTGSARRTTPWCCSRTVSSGIDRTADTDAELVAALDEVCSALARQIVEDGEGATVLLEIEVRRAASQPEATSIARRIATSPLVKTAAFGRDPNWGRVLGCSRLGAVERRLCATRPGPVDRRLRRNRRLRERDDHGVVSPPSEAPRSASSSTSALGVGRPRISRPI